MFMSLSWQDLPLDSIRFLPTSNIAAADCSSFAEKAVNYNVAYRDLLSFFIYRVLKQIFVEINLHLTIVDLRNNLENKGMLS